MTTYHIRYRVVRYECYQIEANNSDEAERMAFGDNELGDAFSDGESQDCPGNTINVEALTIEEERGGKMVEIADFTGSRRVGAAREPTQIAAVVAEEACPAG